MEEQLSAAKLDSFVEEVVSTINGAWRMEMDEYANRAWSSYVREAAPTDRRAMQVARAMSAMMRSQPQRPTIADLRRYVLKEQADHPEPAPVEEEENVSSEIPAWVGGWLLARFSGDDRAWPEQEPGYASLYGEYGHTLYLWPKQALMPAEQRAEFEERARELTPRQLAGLLGRLL